MKKLLLATVALVGMSVASFAADYECQVSGLNKVLGGCKTMYVGPASQEAANLYVKDAGEAVALILEKSPRVKTVSYLPSYGIVIVEGMPGERPHNGDLALVRETFLSKRLYVNSIFLVSDGYRRTYSRNRVMADFGGESRFQALRNFTVADEILAK